MLVLLLIRQEERGSPLMGDLAAEIPICLVSRLRCEPRGSPVLACLRDQPHRSSGNLKRAFL